MSIKLLLFSYLSIKTCVLGAQKNRLIETVLLSTHNICFEWEIKQIVFQYTLLSGGLLCWLVYKEDSDKPVSMHTDLQCTLKQSYQSLSLPPEVTLDPWLATECPSKTKHGGNCQLVHFAGHRLKLCFQMKNSQSDIWVQAAQRFQIRRKIISSLQIKVCS